jgi:hypothetical protein
VGRALAAADRTGCVLSVGVCCDVCGHVNVHLVPLLNMLSNDKHMGVPVTAGLLSDRMQPTNQWQSCSPHAMCNVTVCVPLVAPPTPRFNVTNTVQSRDGTQQPHRNSCGDRWCTHCSCCAVGCSNHSTEQIKAPELANTRMRLLHNSITLNPDTNTHHAGKSGRGSGTMRRTQAGRMASDVRLMHRRKPSLHAHSSTRTDTHMHQGVVRTQPVRPCWPDTD